MIAGTAAQKQLSEQKAVGCLSILHLLTCGVPPPGSSLTTEPENTTQLSSPLACSAFSNFLRNLNFYLIERGKISFEWEDAGQRVLQHAVQWPATVACGEPAAAAAAEYQPTRTFRNIY